jgi:flagellar protein FliS
MEDPAIMYSAGNSYLETQIATATPQKLRLLLIEGALRYGRRTLALWQEQQDEAALEAGIRCRGIISEVLAGIRPDDSELTNQVAAIYQFAFRTLTEAQAQRDGKKLAAVLAILEEEQVTWQQVCEQMPDPPDAESRRQHAPQEITASTARYDAPFSGVGSYSAPSERILLDA